MATSSVGEECKTRGKTWSAEATTTLIDLWAEETIQFALENCKSSRETSEVYRTLQVQLYNRGYQAFSLKEVVNKMKKLRQKYKQEKDKKRRSGNGSSGKEWKFFKKMDQILSERHNVDPPSVVDTMALQSTSAGSEENDSLVHELEQKYGTAEVTIKKCKTCDYEKEIHSSGVHQSQGGCVKVYCDADEFNCPNCDLDLDKEPKDDQVADLVLVKETQVTNAKTSNEEKPKVVPKRKRKTNLEKALDATFEKFKQSSEEEFERFQKMEEERFRKEQEFRAEQRREEREHELQIMRVLVGFQTSAAMPAPVPFPVFQSPGVQVQYPDNSDSNTGSNAYFQL